MSDLCKLTVLEKDSAIRRLEYENNEMQETLRQINHVLNKYEGMDLYHHEMMRRNLEIYTGEFRAEEVQREWA